SVLLVILPSLSEEVRRSPLLMFLKVKTLGLGVETAASNSFGNSVAPKTMPHNDNHLRRYLLISFIIITS
ncbi:hypothetical protein ACKI1Z_41270, partial [Streptomyces galilaeus]|uniref:hypothetical protein n=1 Tax=Streptomyces galilaeus TaxID=33899 RepID=UPI0038F7DC4D